MKQNQVRIATLAIVAMICSDMGCGSREQRRDAAIFTDANTGASIRVPGGWERLKSKTPSIAFFGGPVESGHRLTMMIQKATDSGALEEFVQKSLKELQGVSKSYVELERGSFQTSSHLNGIRLVLKGAPVAEVVLNYCYFFDVGKSKYWVIMARTGDSSPSTDRLFDELAKSFEVRQ